MLYDIANKLTNKRPEVRLAEGHVFKINNTKTGVIMMDHKIKEAEKLETLEEKLNAYDEVIGLMLTAEAREFIASQDYGLEMYEVIFKTITAAIQNKSLEEVEAEEAKAGFRP
ncbi:hypothetical protein [Proteiniclasticum sp. QWL-01]|uniref:hypothetical protein n=1 Tax=Proteiniclasticum sp. QWL-01 TaxID=3036945 RepID=UPI00240ECE61|nr:hypothetical protein [Proteiniclasticum sp. QWL-01]WFF72672.1 hypothetical protein P6M73_15590 [Proteiniclasticum sp. QWL-01]